MTAHCAKITAVPARDPQQVARDIYDRPHDLDPHEQVFLTAVHRITMECARTKGEAVQAWGDGSRAYAAVAYLADCKQRDGLAAALAKYETAHADYLETT